MIFFIKIKQVFNILILIQLPVVTDKIYQFLFIVFFTSIVIAIVELQNYNLFFLKHF